MNSYGFIDSIQPEKTNAVSGYIRFDNISKMLTFIEVLVALAFVSWSSTKLPTVFGEYLFAYSSYAMNQHVVFLLGNVIVVLCYLLSSSKQKDPITIERQVNREQAHNNNNNNNNNNRIEESCKTSEAGSNIEPVKEQLPMKKEMEAETMIKQATKQLERFQRTQSVKLRREISMKPRVEVLRRSVSERREISTVFETVEKLSNEEFRLAVEAFISKQQRIRKQQTMVDQQSY